MHIHDSGGYCTQIPLAQDAWGSVPSPSIPEDQDALLHEAELQEAELQEALLQEALFQDALSQEAFASAALDQLAVSNVGVAVPFGSGTR